MEVFSVGSAPHTGGGETIDEIIVRMRATLLPQLQLESSERALYSVKQKHIVTDKEFALYNGSGYDYTPSEVNLFLGSQEVSQYIAGGAIRSVLLQKQLLWFFLHRGESESEKELTDYQKVWLQIIGFCCRDTNDPLSQLTTGMDDYDPTRAEAWARKPVDGIRTAGFIDFMEEEKNSLLRITQGCYYSFFLSQLML